MIMNAIGNFLAKVDRLSPPEPEPERNGTNSMKVKIVAQFNDEGHDYRHVDLTKPVYDDVPDKIGQNWVTNGWAIAVPSEEK